MSSLMQQSVSVLLRTHFVVDSQHTEVQNAWMICTWDAYEKTGVNMSNLWNVRKENACL